MRDTRAAITFCLGYNNEWRREAANLRKHAIRKRLDEQQRAVLLRDAAAADRQADMWLFGAMDIK